MQFVHDPADVPPSLRNVLPEFDRRMERFRRDGHDVVIEVIPAPAMFRGRRHAVVLTARFVGVRRVVTYRSSHLRAMTVATDLVEWRGVPLGNPEPHGHYTIVDD